VYISLFYLAPGVARRVSALGITQADTFDHGEILSHRLEKYKEPSGY
jgi:hypothetical protein